MNAVGVLLKHLGGEVYKCLLVGNISHKIVYIPSFTTKLVAHHNGSFRIVVDKVHLITFGCQKLHHAATYSFGTTGYYKSLTHFFSLRSKYSLMATFTISLSDIFLSMAKYFMRV